MQTLSEVIMPANKQLEENQGKSTEVSILRWHLQLVNYQDKHTLFAMLFESQSNPSYKPSPEVAQVLWIYLQHQIDILIRESLYSVETERKKHRQFIYQWRWRREWRPSLSVISAAFIAFGRSCLFANTSSTASLNSSWNVYHKSLD